MSGNDQPEPAAIVTGASSGIGEATAHALAAAGFTVSLAARRADLLDRIVSEIAAKGGRALSIPTDLSDPRQTSALAEATLERLGRIDLLVNNAGYGPPFALEQMSRESVRHVFDVNLLSAMQLIGEVTPTMREQGGGRIINIGSLASYIGAPMAAAYAATKGGMEAMSACLRLELAPWNIRVSMVVPGFVDTPTFDKSRRAGQHLRDDPRNPYRQLMADLDDFAKEQLKSAISADQVAQVVVKAATVRSPRTRYFVPRAARTTTRMLGILPERTADKLLLKMYRWGASR